MCGCFPRKGIMGWNSITHPDTVNLGQIRGIYFMRLLSPRGDRLSHFLVIYEK